MKIILIKISVIVLIITGIGLNAFAIEVSGILTEVTRDYIIVDGYKYRVTRKTMIVDKNSPKTKAMIEGKDSFKNVPPYNPKLLKNGQSVTVKIEGGKVEKILVLIEVPK